MYNSGNSMGEIAEKLQKEKIYCPSYNGFQKIKRGIWLGTFNNFKNAKK